MGKMLSDSHSGGESKEKFKLLILFGSEMVAGSLVSTVTSGLCSDGNSTGNSVADIL